MCNLGSLENGLATLKFLQANWNAGKDKDKVAYHKLAESERNLLEDNVARIWAFMQQARMRNIDAYLNRSKLTMEQFNQRLRCLQIPVVERKPATDVFGQLGSRDGEVPFLHGRIEPLLFTYDDTRGGVLADVVRHLNKNVLPVITGVPGCGKTSTLYSLGRTRFVHYFSIDSVDIDSADSYCTDTRSMIDYLFKMAGLILGDTTEQQGCMNRLTLALIGRVILARDFVFHSLQGIHGHRLTPEQWLCMQHPCPESKALKDLCWDVACSDLIEDNEMDDSNALVVLDDYQRLGAAPKFWSLDWYSDGVAGYVQQPFLSLWVKAMLRVGAKCIYAGSSPNLNYNAGMTSAVAKLSEVLPPEVKVFCGFPFYTKQNVEQFLGRYLNLELFLDLNCLHGRVWFSASLLCYLEALVRNYRRISHPSPSEGDSEHMSADASLLTDPAMLAVAAGTASELKARLAAERTVNNLVQFLVTGADDPEKLLKTPHSVAAMFRHLFQHESTGDVMADKTALTHILAGSLASSSATVTGEYTNYVSAGVCFLHAVVVPPYENTVRCVSVSMREPVVVQALVNALGTDGLTKDIRDQLSTVHSIGTIGGIKGKLSACDTGTSNTSPEEAAACSSLADTAIHSETGDMQESASKRPKLVM